jgi:hypothetical protein
LFFPEKWRISAARTGGRVVDGTALEMRHTGNRIEGSNPSLSAIFPSYQAIVGDLDTPTAPGSGGRIGMAGLGFSALRLAPKDASCVHPFRSHGIAMLGIFTPYTDGQTDIGCRSGC